MLPTAVRIVVGFSISLVAGGTSALPAPPDLVLLHGKVFTSDPKHLHAEALAIRGERVVAVGTSRQIEALAGPTTRRIDLGGRTVIPGIDDAHAHLEVFPKSLVEVPIESRDPTWTELREAVTGAVARAPKGSILLGTIGPTLFHGSEATRGSLDKLAPDLPLILVTLTGHAAIVNSAALARAGIRDDQPDPVGGRYERSAEGVLTGTLREYAVFRLFRILAEQTPDADAIEQLRATLAEAAQLGVTTIQDMSDALPPERCVSLLARIPVPVRVRVIRMPGTTLSGRDTREGLSVKSPMPLISVSGTKWLTDGTPLEGTLAPRQLHRIESGAPREPLFDDLALLFPRSELESMLRETLQSGDQLIVHVAGYPAAKAMLEAMKATGGPKVWATRRVRFEHGDGLFADLVPRARELGVIVVQNPTHLAAAGVLSKELFAEFFSRSQLLHSLVAAGIPLALGSDGEINPYRDIMLAATHPDRPSEAITREQAVIASTLTAAYAEFAEKERGSLAPGKLADLAVLSQDIFSVPPSELPKTAAILTLVGGKVAYDAKVLNPSIR